MSLIRIQRRMTPGWRAPDRTLHASRPGKFGNPFEMRDYGDAATAVGRFERWLDDGIIEHDDLVKIFGPDHDEAACRRELDERRRYVLETIPTIADNYDFVSCYCRVGALCHADLIVRRAR